MTSSLLAAVLILSGSVDVTVDAGRVSIHATRASAADILRAWSTAGHVQIVNLHLAPTAPLTLSLDHVAEAEALDVLLRSSGGYLATQRAAVNGDRAASRFERIVVLRSTATEVPAPDSVDTHPPDTIESVDPPSIDEPVVHRILGPDGLPVPDDQGDNQR